MRKRRISSIDLSWMIFDRMRDEIGEPRGMIVAVVPDEALGWRVVLEGRRSSRHLDAKAIKKLRAIEAELRADYVLLPD